MTPEPRTQYRTVAVCEHCGQLVDCSLLLATRQDEEDQHRLERHPEHPAAFRMLASVLGTIQDRRIR